MRAFSLVGVVFCGALLVACESQSPTFDRGLTAMGLVDGTPQAVAVLNFLNHPQTNADLLRSDVGLPAAAATSIEAYKAGPDAVLGTADDGVFGSVHDVDAMAQLGVADAGRLVEYAEATGWLPHEMAVLGTWDGVTFTVAASYATLQLVNHATDAYLRADVGIGEQVADNILAARPLASVAGLSEVFGVTASTLQQLKQHACAVVD